jgi:hypothetical protein
LTLITNLYFQPIPIAIDINFVVFKTPPEIPLASRQHVMAICHLFGSFGLVEIATTWVGLHSIVVHQFLGLLHAFSSEDNPGFRILVFVHLFL